MAYIGDTVPGQASLLTLRTPVPHLQNRINDTGQRVSGLVRDSKLKQRGVSLLYLGFLLL